jgi:hypothetical protein
MCDEDATELTRTFNQHHQYLCSSTYSILGWHYHYDRSSTVKVEHNCSKDVAYWHTSMTRN